MWTQILLVSAAVLHMIDAQDHQVNGDGAFSHSCFGCLSENSTTCDEQVINCDGDQCLTVSQFIHSRHGTLYSIYKGCANTTMCDVYGSMTQDPDVKVRSYAACCTGNKCNNQTFYIPEDDTTPNGVKCPSAFCPGTTEECNKDLKEQECTGTEKYCIDVRGMVQYPDGFVAEFSTKGCINEVACKYGFKYLLNIKELTKVNVSC